MDRDKTCRVHFVDRPPVPVAAMTWAPPSPRVGEIATFNGAASYVFDPVTNTQDHSAITQWTWTSTTTAASR